MSFVNAVPSLDSSTISGASYNGTDYVFSPNDDGVYDRIEINMSSSELIKDWGTTRIYNSSNKSIKNFNSPAGSPVA